MDPVDITGAVKPGGGELRPGGRRPKAGKSSGLGVLAVFVSRLKHEKFQYAIIAPSTLFF